MTVITMPPPRKPIVIFDSPDGTGKTNIAYATAGHLGVPYFRMPSQHDNWRKGKFKEALEFDQPYLVEFLKQTGYGVVIDRAYPAEWVYSQVYGRETNMEVLQRVDDEFARMGAVIVVPLRHDYKGSRPDEVVDEDKLQLLHDKYLEFVEWTRCSTITIYVDGYDNELPLEMAALTAEFECMKNMAGTFMHGMSVTLDRKKEKKYTNVSIQTLDLMDGRVMHFKRSR